MKKKQLMTMLTLIALVAVVGAGATLAYFTDQEEAANVVTLGHVDIELTEPEFDLEDGTKDNTIKDILPGETVKKDPTITVVDGSADAYVRARYRICLKEKEKEKLETLGLTEKDVYKAIQKNVNVDETKWSYNPFDNCYYYLEPLKAGSQVKLFTEVTIPKEWDNNMANLEFAIVVTADAVQADYYEPYLSNGIMFWPVDKDQFTPSLTPNKDELVQPEKYVNP